MIQDFALYTYAIHFGWFVMLISLCFAILKPAANVFLPIAIPVFGPVKMGFGLSFAQISSAVAILYIGRLAIITKSAESL